MGTEKVTIESRRLRSVQRDRSKPSCFLSTYREIPQRIRHYPTPLGLSHMYLLFRVVITAVGDQNVVDSSGTIAGLPIPGTNASSLVLFYR